MSTQPAPTILLVAGEASGDTHGAELIRSLLLRCPKARCLGAGGPRMAAAGQTQLFDLAQHAVVGLIEVAKHYFTFRKLFDRLVSLAIKSQPEAIVLIDFPHFNLKLAKKLRKLLPETKIIFYIGPQVWAWKSGRAKKMVDCLDLLLVIFEFEKDWYARRAPGLKVEWVGHPLLDRMLSQTGAPSPAKSPGVPRLVALLPGSRVGELRKHLPILIATAKLLYSKRRNLRFIWITPNHELLEQGQKILKETNAISLPLDTCVGYQLSHLRRCDLALLASGSISLECAAMGVPQVLFYRVHFLTYQIARMLVKIKYLSMVNVLADRALVPELIQYNLRPQDLSNLALEILDHPNDRALMDEGLRKVIRQLGQPGASDRAAQLILRELKVVSPAPIPNPLAATLSA